MANTDLRIKHNEEIIVKTVKKNNFGRPFDSFSTDPHNKGLCSIYDVLEQLSPKSLKLFCMLARNKDYRTNETVLIRSELDKEEIYALNKGYKQLESLNLVRRVKGETYLLNPDYVIPEHKSFQKIQEKYQKLIGKAKANSVTINELLVQSSNV